MKKVICLIIAAVMVCGTAFASNIGTEPLLNKIFDATNKTIRIQEGLAAGTITSGMTRDSNSTVVQTLSTTSIPTSWISITSLSTNTGDILIGSSTAVYYRLTGDRTISFPIKDVSSIYFDGGNGGSSGDGVSWICTQ